MARGLRLHDLIFDFQPAEAEAVLDAWLEDAADDPSLGYTRDDFAQHLRTEFSTFCGGLLAARSRNCARRWPWPS